MNWQRIQLTLNSYLQQRHSDPISLRQKRKVFKSKARKPNLQLRNIYQHFSKRK